MVAHRVLLFSPNQSPKKSAIVRNPAYTVDKSTKTATRTETMTPTECSQQSFEFQALGRRNVIANFDGGHLSSDGGGALILREIENRTGLLKKLAACFDDRRNQELIEHSVAHLLAQRINGLVLGYEDLNDHDNLRRDPGHALAANKQDLLGQHRREERDRGKALAGASTLNRLELAAEEPDSRYRKIVADPDAIEDLLIVQGVKAIPRRSREIILDFDATDDPLHGNQEGRYFQGYYRHYCYLPLYCFCGNIPLVAKLRDCKRDGCDGTVEALRKIVPVIRRRFGKKVRIILRGDGGFGRDAIMDWCENNQVFYCLGLAKNKRLLKTIAPKLGKLHHQQARGEVAPPVRCFTEFKYETRKTWSRKRRVIAKIELLEKGANPRFIVTNLPACGFDDTADFADRYRARELYEKLYCARGDMENRIKEQQMDLFADRTSTHWMASNQLRLWFSAIAHLIMHTLKASVLKGTDLARASIGTIRLKLFKIAVRIKVSVRRVLVECCSSYPLKELFAKVHESLGKFSPETV